MAEEVQRINDTIEQKKKEFAETREKYRKEKEAIFSEAEYKQQKRYVKQSSGCWIGILVTILGIALFAFPELENGSSGKGVLYVAIAVIVGIVVQKIKNRVFAKLVKKEKYEQYVAIEKEGREKLSEIYDSIEDSKMDLLELEAKAKRANMLFIGAELYNPEKLNLRSPGKFEFLIDGINYGNIRDVASFPVSPGRHVVSVKYSLRVRKEEREYEIENSAPAVVVDVDDNGGFVFFELTLSYKNFTVYTDVSFNKVSSKEFNKLLEEYGIDTYY